MFAGRHQNFLVCLFLCFFYLLLTKNSFADEPQYRWLKGGQLPPHAIAFDPTGRTYATGHFDGSIKLWSVSSGQLLRTLTEDSSGLSLAYSPDGAFLATGGEDSSVSMYRISDGHLMWKKIRRAGYAYVISFSPDGLKVASGNDDGTVQFWRTSDGEFLRSFTGHTDTVTSLSFQPEGNLLLTSSKDHSVRAWRLSDGVNIWTRSITNDALHSAAFSPKDKLAGILQKNGELDLCDANSGELLRTIKVNPSASIDFSPDGIYLVTSSSNTNLWRLSDGKHITILHYSNDGFMTQAAFHPNGKILAVEN
jgi:WD40 repeat protein